MKRAFRSKVAPPPSERISWNNYRSTIRCSCLSYKKTGDSAISRIVATAFTDAMISVHSLHDNARRARPKNCEKKSIKCARSAPKIYVLSYVFGRKYSLLTGSGSPFRPGPSDICQDCNMLAPSLLALQFVSFFMDFLPLGWLLSLVAIKYLVLGWKSAMLNIYFQ